MQKSRRHYHASKRSFSLIKWLQHRSLAERYVIEVCSMLILCRLLENPAAITELIAALQIVCQVLQLWCAIKGCKL